MPFREIAFKVSTSDGRRFTLLEPVTFWAQSGEKILIPAGTCADGFSTPRELWPSIPPFGDGWRAAVLHDYLYRFTSRTKEECDSLFLEAMLSMGVSDVMAKLIYDGVSNLGWKSFQKDREQPLKP